MTIQNGRVSWAEWRPLGPETEPTITPEVLIYHTMVGFLKGTEQVFKANGYDGVESTFGLGGPWDGAQLDGVLWQWQDLRRQADAQFAGNAYADSCECSDGGNPNNGFSSTQLKSLIQLTAEWCAAEDRPCELVPQTGSIGRGGLGWHEWRADWNLDHHVCPGPVREGQLRTIVIPKARAIVVGTPPPPTPKPNPAPAPEPNGKLVVDGILGAKTIGAMQHVLEADKLYHGRIDGIFGPQTKVALQLHLKVRPDGVIGPVTVEALQRHVGAHVDGIWGHDTTMHLQEVLNAGHF